MEFIDKAFIEVQFPVSKISKESYKERKANLGQTLTGLGKWWGRKPLILVRAALLGLLMPASNDPVKDRDIFLKILTMDDEGLFIRKYKNMTANDIFSKVTEKEKQYYFNENNGKIVFKNSITKEERKTIEQAAFLRLTYDDKIRLCRRPEEIELTDKEEWTKINEHLGTNANNLHQLIRELGIKRFGHIPKVGDCFSGGGNIPFEAARMGADVFASDLNPISMLLTWGALNINGASDEKVEKLKDFQKKIYDLVDNQITDWGIEHDSKGNRALYYLYCNETKCPECGWKVPLAPSWIIGKGTKTIAILSDNRCDGFDIRIKSNASKEEINNAENYVTARNNGLYCPHCKKNTPISAIRRDRVLEDGTTKYGLRLWDKDDIIPRPDDVFQERLYCIKWEGKDGEKFYAAITEEDIKREEKVIQLLRENFHDWQEKGYLPDMMIEIGDETTRLSREKGWKHWHQLFNPRHLFINSLFLKIAMENANSIHEKIVGILGLNKLCNWSSKLAIWDASPASEKGAQTFSNQALNTLSDFMSRTHSTIKTSWFFNINNYQIKSYKKIIVGDARNIDFINDIWLTDPPYADAINYHELSEFFLSWDKKLLKDIFPEWYTDSKRALAIKGKGTNFNKSMIEVYKNLAEHMPDNGYQIVMFTHQDVKVWAELSMILWSSGLRVTAAWNIATETDASGLKHGNYVKGTVLLVLKKQTSNETAFLYELYPEIEEEVRKQIETMHNIDEQEEPNFADPDYLLAAYAASLKVLTSYKHIEDIDVQYELSRGKKSKEESPIEKVIKEAVKIAYDCIIPQGFDSYTWKTLSPQERFYIKALDLEKDNIYQISALQELARGFGVTEYTDMLANSRANEARLKTAYEYGTRQLKDSSFGASLLRNILAAIYVARNNDNTMSGRDWLHNELPGYWNQRNTIIEVLSFIASLEISGHTEHWKKDAYYARLLEELVKNDSI